MPITTAQFAQIAQAMGLCVLVCALITGVAFVRQWGWRFRMVGVTSFTVVLTIGLFVLGLTPLTRTSVPGAAPYTVVYDRSGPQAVIAVPADITVEKLEATLRQAASNLFSPGRTGLGQTDRLTIWARTVLHPREGVSQPVYLGQVQRSLVRRNDPNMKVQIFSERLAKLPS